MEKATTAPPPCLAFLGRSRKAAAAAPASRSPCARSAPAYQAAKKRPYGVAHPPPHPRKKGAESGDEL